MDRDRDDVRAVGVGEVLVAALGASELPALLLEDSDQLSRANLR
jgi:hypothetical protein